MASRYRAFISYAHADEREASRLIRRLETYRVPRRLVGSEGAQGQIGARLGRFFRDRDELASAGDLTAAIRQALAQSDALIVVCSPAAAQSKWVDIEIEAFRESEPARPVFCYLVAGEPGPHSFPGALGRRTADGDPIEALAADARPQGDGRHRAFLKLAAGLLGVEFDRLARRDSQRRQRRMAIVLAAALAGMTLTTWLAVSAHVARNEARHRQAQTEELLGFMLGDLHQKLRGVGRLDLMASVSDKVLDLFAQSDPDELVDSELARQSQALVQIGQVRLEQRQYEPASDAFRRAYQRSVELMERHPRDGELLFDRGQAEFWIGYAAWQRGDLDLATRWLSQYRDSAVALAGLDPGRVDWLRESAYGYHNLAVLAMDRGDLPGARQSFESELATLAGLSARVPDGAELTFDTADTLSWLGTVAEREGDLAGSAARFRDQADLLEALIRTDPKNARWIDAQAKALHFQGLIASITGRLEEAGRTIDEVIAVRERMTRQDPENLVWQRFLTAALLLRAELAAGTDGDEAEVAQRVAVLLDGLPESSDTEAVNLLLSRSHALAARVALQGRDTTTAAEHANRATAYARRLEVGDDDAITALADALIETGQVRAALGDTVAAGRWWRDAREALSARVPETRYWRLLDAWVRANRLLGRGADADAAIARLTAMDYLPLQPWPSVSNGPSDHHQTQGEPHGQR